MTSTNPISTPTAYVGTGTETPFPKTKVIARDLAHSTKDGRRATNEGRTTDRHRNPSEPTMTGPTARISARSPRPRRRFNMAPRLTTPGTPRRFHGGRPSAGLVRPPDGSSPSSPSAQSSRDDRPSVAENTANTVMTQPRVMANCKRTFSVR